MNSIVKFFYAERINGDKMTVIETFSSIKELLLSAFTSLTDLHCAIKFLPGGEVENEVWNESGRSISIYAFKPGEGGVSFTDLPNAVSDLYGLINNH